VGWVIEVVGGGSKICWEGGEYVDGGLAVIEVGEQRLQGVMALGTMAATGVVLHQLRLSAACATQRFGDCGLAGGKWERG
jgi:hypothetical protein